MARLLLAADGHYYRDAKGDVYADAVFNYGFYSHYLDAFDEVLALGRTERVDTTPEGRVAAWEANTAGPANLARACAERGVTLVHISSDYVFDGTHELHGEDEPLSPLSVYGQSKAAGDLAVAGCPRYYILRSSWVIGDGRNFVKTMKGLSDRCADPEDKLNEVTVVDDQLGRLTFTKDMAAAIFHLLGYWESDAEPSAPALYGTYDCTGSGRVASWTEIAAEVFDLADGNGSAVCPVTTAEYYASAQGPIVPRPEHSALDLAKLEATGFSTPDWEEGLACYMRRLCGGDSV